MGMRMHGMVGGGQHGAMFHGGEHHAAPMALLAGLVLHWLLCIVASVCFLGAITRASNSLKLMSRIKALDAVPEAFTEEERTVLIRKITTRALGPM
jgi:hypothetical protein